MQQSVIYQEWREEFLAEGRQEGRQEGLREGRQEGLQEGLQEGRREEARSLILRLLGRRFGMVAPEIRAQVQSLSLEQLEGLGDALLDFETLMDLEGWLQTNAGQG